MKSSGETKKQTEYNDLNHDFIQTQKTVPLNSFVFCIRDVAIRAEVGNKGLKIVILGSLKVISWTPNSVIPSEAPGAANSKIRDTVNEPKTQWLSFNIRK